MITRHRPTGVLAMAGLVVATAAAILGTLSATASTASTASTVSTVSTASGQPSSATPKTHRRVVRPVTRAGRPAAGWTVRKETGSVQCFGSSISAVNSGISTCYPTAAYLPSCWKSTHHTVLCLRYATSKRLVRVRYTGAYPKVTAPARPSPQRLVLSTGNVCQIRVGGAWGPAPRHPRWVGFYSCRRGSIYGPPNGTGINKRTGRWRVHLVVNKSILTRGVSRAVLVGTAA